MMVRWIDVGREAKCAPNPLFPNGVDADLSHGAAETCIATLPYPAPRCGLWEVICERCGQSAAITAAGRPDDPRLVKLPCDLENRIGSTGDYPRGKLDADDEGALQIAISVQDKTVRVDFGKQVSWLAFDKKTALELAGALRKKAEEIR